MKSQWSTLISLFLATSAAASVPTPVPPPSESMPTRTVTFEATTRPVTVHSGPANALPNASHYQVPTGILERQGHGR